MVPNKMLAPPPQMKLVLDEPSKEGTSSYEILATIGQHDHNKLSTTIPKPSRDRKRARRRSSPDNAIEAEYNRRESRQIHSNIEKRRRIKILREFEALKYLIPACRDLGADSICGMQKLVILKASVEYIQYLHRVVRAQNERLRVLDPDHSFDSSFAEIDLNVNLYRDVSTEFCFKSLFSLTTNMQLESPLSSGLGTGVDPSLYLLGLSDEGTINPDKTSHAITISPPSDASPSSSPLSHQQEISRRVQISALLN